MDTKLTRKQVYKKYKINTEKQKFLDDTPLNKIIYYEEFNKSLTKKKKVILMKYFLLIFLIKNT